MKHDRDTISLRHGTNVVGASNGTSNRGFLVGIRQAFPGEVSGASLGGLNDNGCLDVSGSFKNSICDRGRSNVLANALNNLVGILGHLHSL